MGKSSRAKRERRERGAEPIARLISGFSATSLIAVLEAASASPTASHCGPSLASLYHAVALYGRNTAQAADSADLPELVAAVRTADPRIATLEDFRPYDPRASVLVPWGSDLFRIIAGSLERPTAMIRQHRYLAAVIDPVLIPEIGFGLTDVGELVLRRIDQVATSLEPHWPSGPAADVNDDPHVSAAEIAAVADLAPLTDLVSECTAPDRARSALARFTFPVKDLPYDLAHPNAVFGPALAVHSRKAVTALPAAFLIEALSAIGVELAGLSVSTDARSDAAFGRHVAARVAGLLQGSALKVIGPFGIGPRTPTIHSLVMFDNRQILAMDVAAGLTPSSVQHQLDRGAEILKAIRPGTQMHKSGSTWQVPTDARITRVQVIAGPQNMPLLGASGPTMRLEDLEWILHSAKESSIDLWHFVHDLENPVGPGRSFAWDMIDRWEVWRERKSFYLGGAPFSFMAFTPHAAVAEWEDTAQAALVERALHLLELPSVDEWPIVAIDDQVGGDVGNMRTDEVFQVVALAVPVAVSKTDPAAPPEHSSTLWDLAAGVAWKLKGACDAFVDAARRSHLRSLRIHFQFEERDSGPPLTLSHYDEGVLTIGWDSRLHSALANDSIAVETSLGGIVANVFDESLRDDFVLAWRIAPPGIRMDGYPFVQSAKELPDPLDDHEAIRSRTLRQLGEHLAGESVSPGIFEGPQATAFESRTVFPWLLARMHDSLADLNPDSLLPFALTQLERVHHQRQMEDLRFRWRRGFPSYVDSEDADYREPNSRAARAVSLMVEEILAHPPTGHTEVPATLR